MTGNATDGTRSPTVLAVPDYRGSNPYQAELAEALDRQDLTVRTRSPEGVVLPLLRTVREEGRPDLLHVHFFHPFFVVGHPWLRTLRLSGLVSAVLALQIVVELGVLRLLGVSIVWTAHDLVNHERRAVSVEMALKHAVVRGLADAVIVHCESAGDLLVEALSLPESARESFVVVPHGHFIDSYHDETTKPEAREALGLEENAVVFLYFGWIRPYKNVPLLIERFAEIEAQNARLLVVGNPRSERLERAVRSRAEADDRVRTVLEFVPDAAVQSYMNAADAVVLPFRVEERSLLTSGSVVLAMGFGNAVVAPTVGCVDELVDPNGGFTYERHDGSLRRALEEAIDADLEGMGEYNREKVRRYDWDRIGERTSELYRAELRG